MFKNLTLIPLLLLAFALLVVQKVPSASGQQAGGNVRISLSTNSSASPAEVGQPFPVFVNVDTQGDTISALDVTLRYTNTSVEAVKVLPGRVSGFENGYLGVTGRVDTDPDCKQNRTDQVQRLKCAIDQPNGLVSITAVNSDMNVALAQGQDPTPTPANRQVSGQLTFATVIFVPLKVGSSGDIRVVYSEPGTDGTHYLTNAYSWVQLDTDQNSEQKIMVEDPAPSLQVTAQNQTDCRADLNQNQDIDISDYFAFLGNVGTNCEAEFCAGDYNSDGVIDTADYFLFLRELGSVQANVDYCVPLP